MPPPPFQREELTMSWKVQLPVAKEWYCNTGRKRLRLNVKKQRDAAAEEKTAGGASGWWEWQ